jgi:hypothetical protein
MAHIVRSNPKDKALEHLGMSVGRVTYQGAQLLLDSPADYPISPNTRHALLQMQVG